MEWFWFATASALFSAAAAITQKKILFSLPALEFSFFLSLIVSVLSLWIPFAHPMTNLSFLTLGVLTVKSFLGAFAFLFVMLSLERNEMSSALPLLGTTPAVTALLAFLILREMLVVSEILGIVLIILGTYIVEKRPGVSIFTTLRSSHTHGVIATAVFLFAISAVADRFLVAHRTVHPNIVLFYQHIIYTIVFGVAMWVKRTPFRFSLYKEVLYLTLTVALCTFAYRAFQLEAARFAPIAVVLAIKRTSIFYASFLGGTFFKEERLPQKLLGAACIIAGGFFIVRHLS